MFLLSIFDIQRNPLCVLVIFYVHQDVRLTNSHFYPIWIYFPLIFISTSLEFTPLRMGLAQKSSAFEKSNPLLTQQRTFWYILSYSRNTSSNWLNKYSILPVDLNTFYCLDVIAKGLSTSYYMNFLNRTQHFV